MASEDLLDWIKRNENHVVLPLTKAQNDAARGMDRLLAQSLEDSPSGEEEPRLAPEFFSIGLSTIRLAPTDQPGAIPRPRVARPVPPWLLTSAAALVAAVSIAWFARNWLSGGNPPAPDQQANGPPEGGQPQLDRPPRRQLESPPKPRSVIVEGRKGLEEKPTVPPGESQPAHANANDGTPKAPALVASDPEAIRLLTAIGNYPAAQPLDVASPEIRSLRERALAYQKQPLNPPDAEIAAFVARSAETDDNEREYLEFFAERAQSSPQDPAKIAACVARIMSLRFTQPSLVGKDKPLVLFLNKAMAVRSTALDAGLRAQVNRVVESLPDEVRPRTQKRPLLLCRLPSGMRQGSDALYGDLQAYAKGQGDPLDPALLDFLLRARRSTDTLGLIIQVYWSNIEQLTPQDALMVDEQWKATLAAAALGIPVKVVNRLQTKIAVRSEAYARALLQAKQLHIGMYAYVNTNGGGKPLAEAKAEVGRWDELYPGHLSGIYIDNVSNSKEEDRKYFEAIYTYATVINKNWQLIGGSENLSDEPYLELSPNAMLCIDGGVPVTKGREWQAKYDPSRFAAVVRRSDDAPAAEEIITRAAANHYGWVYVTDEAATSYENYKTLPPYFERQAIAIRDLNASIRGKAAVPSAKKRGTR